MFSKKQKKSKLKFINLAEHLAHQNDIVSRTMDSLLQHVVENEDATTRSDWSEIKKTSEQFSQIETSVAEPTSIVPQPKAAGRASRKSTRRIS